jgi:hypothetical protein
MPLVIVKIDGDKGQQVDALNVHQFVQHDLESLTVTLSRRQRDESFALAYIFGHVSSIQRLRLEDGTVESLSKFLSLWDRHKQTISVHTLELCGIMEWDTTATALLNQICLDGMSGTTTLTKLKIFTLAFSIQGINLTYLRELIIPMGRERTMYSLTSAITTDSQLYRLEIGNLNLANLSEDILEFFCLRLYMLPNLHSLIVTIKESELTNMQRLARSIPVSVGNLKIVWHEPSFTDLALLAPAMPTLKALDLELVNQNTAQPSDPTALMEIVVPLLEHCQSLQHLAVGPIRKPVRQFILHPLLKVMSTWTTLKTCELGFPLVLDDACCDTIYLLVQNNKNIRDFQYPLSKGPKNFYPKLLHYLRLNRLRHQDLLLTNQIPLSLWPRLLEKAAQWPSVVFEILKQKNDVLIINQS